MYELGLSISDNRVLEISADLGNDICHHYMTENVVCPPKLKCGLFTTAAVTPVLLVRMIHSMELVSLCFNTQMVTSVDILELITDNAISRGATAHLLESYVNIIPITVIKHDPFVPKLKGPNKTNYQLIPQAVEKGFRYVSFCTLTILINYL